MNVANILNLINFDKLDLDQLYELKNIIKRQIGNFKKTPGYILMTNLKNRIVLLMQLKILVII
jgi:hypothetical protein